MHNYPLSLRFKVIAISSQIYILDANNNEICYVKQKAFKLKEDIRIYTNEDQRTLMGMISARSIIDFGATYDLKDENEQPIGEMRRHGMRSILQAYYEVKLNDQVKLTITESNPVVKFIDGFVSGIPIIGVLANYILHPKYTVTDAGNNVLFELKKMPSFFERRFEIACKASNVDEHTEHLSLLAMTLAVLMEGDDG